MRGEDIEREMGGRPSAFFGAALFRYIQIRDVFNISTHFLCCCELIRSLSYCVNRLILCHIVYTSEKILPSSNA